MLMSDQLQADSVLQSMPLLLYWALSYRGPRQNSNTWVQVTRRRHSSLDGVPVEGVEVFI